MRLVVIGGGPAGVEAATTAAPYADVALVSAEPVGAWRPLASWLWLRAAAAGERDAAAITAGRQVTGAVAVGAAAAEIPLRR